MKQRRSWTLAASGLLAGVSLAAMAQVIAGAALTHGIEASLRRVAGLRFGAIEVNAWTGRAAIHRLSLAAGTGNVSVEDLSFTLPVWRAPAFVTPAAAAGESASAQNIVIAYSGTTVRIPKVEAIGTNMTSDDLAKIFDPGSSVSLSERVEKLTADRIAIPEVAFNIVTPDVTEQLKYVDMSLEGAEKGKVKRFAIKSGVFTVAGPKIPDTISGTIGAMTGRDLDLLLYSRFLGESRKSPDEPLQTFYNDVHIDGVEARGKEFAVKIGAISGDKFMARPLATPISALQTMTSGKNGERPTPERSRRALAVLADLYGSISVGSTDFKDVAATFGHDTKVGSLQIAHFGIADLAKARFGGMSIDGFRLSTPDALVAVKTFGIRGFDFKPGLDGLTAMANSEGGMPTANPRSFVPTLEQLFITGVEADVRDKKKNGNAENGGRDVFTLAKFEINGSNYQLGIPATLSAHLDHLALPLPPNDPNSQQLAQLGYAAVDVSSALDYTWNEADSALSLKTLSLSGEGMGTVAASALFGNVTKDLFIGDAAVAQAALLGSNIKSADLRMDNFGLIGKLMEQAARQQGKSVEQVRQDAITGVQASIKQTLGDAPQAVTLSDAIVAFLKDPKSLQISAKSSKGVSVADAPLLQNPPEFLKRLDITATANR